ENRKRKTERGVTTFVPTCCSTADAMKNHNLDSAGVCPLPFRAKSRARIERVERQPAVVCRRATRSLDFALDDGFSSAMQKTMQAIAKSKAEPGLWLEEVPVPQVAPDDVLIRTKKAS